MAERFEALESRHIDFIRAQQLFFVGTAVADGHVNVSPKGMDSLRVLDEKRIAWLNLTGSGNESAAHVQHDPRMTLMWCSFDKQPLILRAYGEARVCHAGEAGWPALYGLFPDDVGARQIFEVSLHLVQTSCGFAVPFYEFAGERDTLVRWAEKKGSDGIRRYWEEKNRLSLDGEDTGLPG